MKKAIAHLSTLPKNYQEWAEQDRKLFHAVLEHLSVRDQMIAPLLVAYLQHYERLHPDFSHVQFEMYV